VPAVRTPVLLGIDAGSSFLKVAAFDPEGRLVDSEQSAYETLRTSLDRAEQNPELWIDMVGQAVRAMLRRGRFLAADVAGIAPTGRGSCGIFVDAAGAVIYPHWLDDRHGPDAAELIERFGGRADDYRSLMARTLHLRRVAPDVFGRLAHPLFVHDFLAYRLSGTIGTDPASGPRTPDMRWPEDVWTWIRGDASVTPPPVRTFDAMIGTLVPATAERIGLPAGIPIANGGHDGACANTGAGAVSVGQVCLTMGTNVVARAIGDHPAPQLPWRGISAYHYWPGRWCCGGDAGHAGAAATWIARILKGNHTDLEAVAVTVAPGSTGVTFLPFLLGQIAPERRPNARAAYLGLGVATGPAELYRATLEGVSFLYRSIRVRLGELGFGDGDWRVSGGGARSDLWMRIMASLLERTLLIGEPEEGPRGAAMMAAVGLGWYSSIEACSAAWVRTERAVDPDPALTDAYLPHYERYLRLVDLLAGADPGG
jgi:xylulokinase